MPSNKQSWKISDPRLKQCLIYIQPDTFIKLQDVKVMIKCDISDADSVSLSLYMRDNNKECHMPHTPKVSRKGIKTRFSYKNLTYI
jgi:hypothetical protein